MKNLQVLWKTVRKEYHLVISGLLLIIIPAAMILNTAFLINNVKKDIDIEVQRLGNQVANIIGRSIRDQLSNVGAVDAIITDIARDNDDVKSIDILQPLIENNAANASHRWCSSRCCDPPLKWSRNSAHRGAAQVASATAAGSERTDKTTPTWNCPSA